MSLFVLRLRDIDHGDMTITTYAVLGAVLVSPP